MQDDNLSQICASAFEQQVAQMFDEAEERAKPALARGDTKVRAPIIGDVYDSWSNERTAEVKGHGMH